MTRLHHTALGSGERAVVFLHGLFGQGKNFTSIARTLVEEDPGLQCLLVDLPNHGRSDWTDSIDVAHWSDLVADHLTTVLPGRRAVVVGHSLGGKTAMQLALRHPELVQALAVVDISPVATTDAREEFATIVAGLTGLDLVSLESRQEAHAQLASQVTHPVVRGFLLQNLRHDHRAPVGEQWRWQFNLDLVARDLDDVGGWPEPPAVPYPGPVVWIAGEHSSYVRPEHDEAMRALFPRTRLVTVKDAGHWVHSEQPDTFTEILRHLLASVSP